MGKITLTREEKVQLYEKLVASHPDAILKGDTIPYTSMNGHMYSFLSKGDEVALKLPEEEKDQFLKKYASRLAENYGIVQKQFVVIPDSLLGKTADLKKYFAISYEYVKGLKPKPTAKDKKSPGKKSPGKKSPK
jgi:hypothetical protein